jgi:hypothetical protein
MKPLSRYRLRSVGIVLAWAALYPLPAGAEINLEFRPISVDAVAGDVVELALYAVSDDETDQPFAALDLAFTWDPAHLGLLGKDDTGSAPKLFSGFPVDDPFGLNEEVPPQDGDGLYSAFALLGMPIDATPEGTLVTTLQFRALLRTPGTVVEMIRIDEDPRHPTVVWDGRLPNNPVTGDIGQAVVRITGCIRNPEWECDGDVDGNGVVNPVDVGLIQAAFGTTDPDDLCQYDVDCNGVINPVDAGIVQSLFGTCNPPRSACP